MALPFSNTAGRTLERLRNAFVETARGAREVVGAPLRPDLPDDDIPRLRNRIDACLEGKGGDTARRARAAELGEAYLSLSPAGRKKFLLTLANEYGLTPRRRDGRGRALARHQGAAARAGAPARAAGGAAAARVRRRAGGREVRGRPARRAADPGQDRCRGTDAERRPAAPARQLVRCRLPRPGADRLALAGGAAREAGHLRGGAHDPLVARPQEPARLPTGAATPSSIRACRTSR